jgi:hypothetical protein
MIPAETVNVYVVHVTPTTPQKKEKKRKITKIVLEKNKHKIHVRNTRWDITTSFVLIAMSLLLVQSRYSV